MNNTDDSLVNSVLQCLSNVSILTKYILCGHITHHSSKKCHVANAYVKLICEMWSGRRSFADATKVKEQVYQLIPQMTGYYQQDNPEFLLMLLDALHKDFNLQPSNSSDKDETSIISAIFHGSTHSTTICYRCYRNYCTIKDFSILHLTLPINTSCSRDKILDRPMSQTLTLSDCLNELLKPEVLVGDQMWYCDTCQTLTNAERRLELWRLPRVLILQLKRIDSNISSDAKTDVLLRFPLDSLD